MLAIDTSAGTSVAVVDRDRVLAEASETDTRRHAEHIDVLLRRVLAASGAAPAAFDAVAAGMGPGPFTGLRVGIAAARAFAAGIRRPVLPLVSHDAVAWGRTAPTLVVTDARRREVAWSAYDAPDADGLPARVHGPELAPSDGVPEHVDRADRYERVDAAAISAASLGLLAHALAAAGRPFPASDAVYLRPPDVTLSAPKRVTG